MLAFFKHILKLIGFTLLSYYCQLENLKAQKALTLSSSLIYDFNYFNTSRNVNNYYSNAFNKRRKTIIGARPSGAYGLELSYGLSKKWMGDGGLIISHYNYQIDSKDFIGVSDIYGYRLISIPITFKYYPMHDQEYFYVKAGFQIDNMVDVYGIDVRNTPGIFTPPLDFFNKFQPGYTIAIACENHSSNTILFSFGAHIKTKFTELSDQFESIDQAGEVLSAFGLECKIGYRFQNGYSFVSPN